MNNEISDLLTSEVTDGFVDELLAPVDVLAIESASRENGFFKAIDLDFEGRGFGVENVFNRSPYNVEALSLFTFDQNLTRFNQSPLGVASGTFDGDGELYDIRVGYYDENDGQGRLSLSLTGGADIQASITLDQDLGNANPDLGGAAPGPDNFVISDFAQAVRIDAGTVFTVQGERGRSEVTGALDGEGVRFASIEFVPVGEVEPPTSPITLPAEDFAVTGMAVEDGPEVLVEIEGGKSTSTYNITSQTVNEKGIREGNIIVRPKGENDQLVIQAEDLTLDGYIPENDRFSYQLPGTNERVQVSAISLIERIKDDEPKEFRHSETGRASGFFSDVSNYEPGVYDVDIIYYDEGDGISQLTFSVDDNGLDTWRLEEESTTRIPTFTNRRTRTVATGVSLIGETEFSIDAIQETEEDGLPSDEDRKLGKGNLGQEGARVDFIEFNRVTPFIFDPEDDFQDLGVGETPRYVTFEFNETDANGNVIAKFEGQIKVEGVNDAPEADNDTAMTGEDASVEIDVLANDIDIDNTDILKDPNASNEEDRPEIIDTLVVTQIEGSTADEVELASGAIVRRDNSTGELVYDPNGQFDELLDDETDFDTFEYTLEDGRGGSDSATVTVTIKGRGNVDANNDEATVKEDLRLTTTGNVLTNDVVLPEGSPKFVESVSYQNQPIALNTVTPINDVEDGSKLGDILIQTDGGYSFTLNNDNPKVDELHEDGEDLDIAPISYVLSNGSRSREANLNIAIEGTDDVNANNDVAIVKEDEILTVAGNLLANDEASPDDTPIFVESVSYQNQAISFNTVTPINDVEDGSQLGDILIQTDGSYSFTLNNSNTKVQALLEGGTGISLAPITYTLSAETPVVPDTANLQIRILGTDPFINANDDQITVKEDEILTATGNVLFNDELPAESMPVFVESVSYRGQPIAFNTVTPINDADGSHLGDILIQTDGGYSFTLDNANPKVDELNEGNSIRLDGVELDAITYTLSSGTPLSPDSKTTAIIPITILGSNDGPVTEDDTFPIIYREGHSVQILASQLLDGRFSGGIADSDVDNSNLQIVGVSSTSGTVTLDPASQVITYTHTPNVITHDILGNPIPGFAPVEAFKYQLSDGVGGVAEGSVFANIQDSNPFVSEPSESIEGSFNNCFSEADCERLIRAGVPGFRAGQAVEILRSNQFQENNSFAIFPDGNVPDDTDLRVQIAGTLGRAQGRPEVDLYRFEFNPGEVVTFDIDTGDAENLDTHLFLFNQDTVTYLESTDSVTGLGNDPRVNPLVDYLNTPGARDALINDPGSSASNLNDPFFNYTIPDNPDIPNNLESRVYYLGVATEDTDWNRDRGHFQSIAENNFAGNYTLNVSIENPQAIQFF